MSEYQIECIECGWVGTTYDLVRKTEEPDDKDFSYCPDCGEKDHIQDIDEEE